MPFDHNVGDLMDVISDEMQSCYEGGFSDDQEAALVWLTDKRGNTWKLSAEPCGDDGAKERKRLIEGLPNDAL